MYIATFKHFKYRAQESLKKTLTHTICSLCYRRTGHASSLLKSLTLATKSHGRQFGHSGNVHHCSAIIAVGGGCIHGDAAVRHSW